MEVTSIREKLDFRNWNIPTKFLVVMLILSLIPLLTAITLSTNASAAAVTQQTRTNLSRLAYSTAQRIEQFLIDNHNFIRMAANEPEVIAFLSARGDEERAAQQADVDGVVANLLHADPALDLVGFYDLSGVVLSHNNRAIVGKDYSFRDYVQAALTGRQFTSGIQVGWTTDTPGVNASAPVLQENVIIGAIATRIQGKFITEILRSTLEIESEDVSAADRQAYDIFLIDEYGLIMSHSDESSEWLYHSLGTIQSGAVISSIVSGRLLGGECPGGGNECDSTEKTPRQPLPIPATQPLADTLRAALQTGQVGSARYCHPAAVDAPFVPGEKQCAAGAWHVVGYAPVRDPFAPANLFLVVVDVPERIFLHPIERQKTQGYLIAAGMASLAIIASLALSRTLARPIRRLAAVAYDVEMGKPFEPAYVADVAAHQDEVGNLARVFSDMVLALRARMAELRTVYQIGQDITATLEVDETLQAILDRVRDVVACDTAEIMLFDRQENELLVAAWKGEAGLTDTRGERSKLNEGFAGGVGQSRRSMLVRDTRAWADAERQTAPLGAGTAVYSLLGVPLVIRDRLVGTLVLRSARPEAFDEDDQRLLETIAPQAAIAIEKAQQVREREQKLQKEIEQLRIEIDEARRRKQVTEIVETDYFRALRSKAQDIRKRGE